MSAKPKASAVRKGLGIVLILAGIVLIPIPILPGIPLIVAGAAMLGGDHPLVRSGRTWLQNRGILNYERNANELPDMQR